MSKFLGSTVGSLRDAGYAVVIISPEDLDGCSPEDFEDTFVSYERECIDALKQAEVTDG